MTLDNVQIASLAVGVVLPILVGLVTKHSTNSSIKAVLLLFLSAVSGFLSEFLVNANFNLEDALITWLVTFVIGVATQFGLWAPTGVSGAAQSVPISLVPSPRRSGSNSNTHVAP